MGLRVKIIFCKFLIKVFRISGFIIIIMFMRLKLGEVWVFGSVKVISFKMSKIVEMYFSMV